MVQLFFCFSYLPFATVSAEGLQTYPYNHSIAYDILKKLNLNVYLESLKTKNLIKYLEGIKNGL